MTTTVELDHDELLARWLEVIGPVVDELVAEGLVIETGWEGAPLLVTPPPLDLPGVWLDVDELRRTLEVFAKLPHTVGRWAGAPFRLLDWQVVWVVAPIFALKGADGLRVVRTAWIEVPRKNGKSTLAAALGIRLAFADREPGAEVYAAAGDKTQAGAVFRPARLMAIKSRTLRRKLGPRGIQRNLLEHDDTGSIFRPLSSDGDRQHGLNVHGAVIDEVHVHKTADLIDALETGVGARSQPLVVFITTADEGREGSIYDVKRELIEATIAGTVPRNPRLYAVVFGVDGDAADFDPFAIETIRAANPGIGFSVTEEYLLDAAATASASPSSLNRYLRLHLNVRTKQVTRWLPLKRWDACGAAVDDAEWRHLEGVGAGLDLSTTTDLTAWALSGRSERDGAVIWRVLLWVPEETASELERKRGLPMRAWAEAGWLRYTEGNVVDYQRVRDDVLEDLDRLEVWPDEVGFDPWNATETVQHLEREGMVMLPMRQGYGTLSPPTKAVERLVLGSTPALPRLRHGGSPAMRWQADAVSIMQDPAGNVKPVKPDRLRTAKRIDGVVAAIMAEARRMAREVGGSAYEEADVEVV